jgi:hypothetical protein
MDTSALRLTADDADGLGILAAAVQDAVLKREDMKFDARTRAFGLEINRFQWERAGKRAPYHRSRAVLAFGGVLKVRSMNLTQDREEILSILDVRFQPDPEPPSGVISVVFAGGPELQLVVECLDTTLYDTGVSWPTRRRPDHGRSA